MLDAVISYSTMTNVIPIQLNPSTTWMYGQWRERKDVVLAMVLLIEDILRSIPTSNHDDWGSASNTCRTLQLTQGTIQ